MSLRVTLENRLRGLTARQVALALFLLAFAVRVAAVFATHSYRNQDRFELERVALSLAQTGVYGNPYAIPTGPTAHVSPGYPVILAIIFRLFGTGTVAEVVKQVFASACSALVCASIPAVAGFLRLPGAVGLGAALFTALLPLKLRTETEGDWEAPFAALGLMLVVSVSVFVWREKRFDTRCALLVGMAWGVVLLFISAFVALMAAMLVIGLLAAPVGWRGRYLQFSTVACLCVVLVLTPWTLRNWRVLGSPVFGRDNSGIELRISNNDYAGPGEHENFNRGVYHRFHPLQSVAEATKVRAMGEIGYNRALTAEARAWIAAHPQHFAQLCFERAAWYWFYPERIRLRGVKPVLALAKALLLWVFTALGIVGLWYLYRRDRVAFVVVVTVLVVVPLPDYLVHVGVRHRYVIDWLLVLLAGFTLWNWWPRKSNNLATRPRG